MIVRNYFQNEGSLHPAHGGQGEVRNVFLFGEGDFESGLRFVIYTEIEPGRSIGYHTHGANEEVYVVLEGGGRMTVNGETRPVQAGDVILNKPGWSHGLENDTDRPLKILVFEAALAG